MIKKDVAFSSPVSTVYATNAWDHGSRLGDQERLAFNDSSFLTKARVMISKSNERQISQFKCLLYFEGLHGNQEYVGAKNASKRSSVPYH